MPRLRSTALALRSGEEGGREGERAIRQHARYLFVQLNGSQRPDPTQRSPPASPSSECRTSRSPAGPPAPRIDRTLQCRGYRAELSADAKRSRSRLARQSCRRACGKQARTNGVQRTVKLDSRVPLNSQGVCTWIAASAVADTWNTLIADCRAAHQS